jgi:hypothetical protein
MLTEQSRKKNGSYKGILSERSAQNFKLLSLTPQGPLTGNPQPAKSAREYLRDW